MKKYIAELFGTFVLVLIGCGTVVFSAPFVGQIGIALAFGLAVMAMAYTIGSVSGAHVNPAVTLGVLSAGRMSLKDAIGYIIFQFIGATIGAAVLYYMVQGKLNGYNVAEFGLGQNGWGANYGSGYDMTTAIIFEFLATFIFVKVILKTTESDLKIAGVVIGLTLVVLHILGLRITGVSVNPARSFGPAFFVGGQAMAQLWLFLVVPAVAGIFAGICSRCCGCGCCCKCGCNGNCNGECGCENCTCKTEEKKKIENDAVDKPAPRKHAPAHHTARRTGSRPQGRRQA